MLLTSIPLLNNDTNFHSPMSGPILLPLYTLQTSVQEIRRHKSFNQWFGYGINYHPSPLLGLALQHPNKSKRPFGPRARSKFPILPHLSPPSNTPAEREFLARARPSNYSLYLSNMGQCYIYEVIHVDNDVWTALFYKALSLRFSISLIWWAENNDSHVRNLEKPINV